MSLREALYLECEVVHMALSCCSKESSHYIVLAITACFISNYLVFSADIQHLLCEMISMVPNDRVGLTAYSRLIHCIFTLIAVRANTYRGVIRHGNTIFFWLTLHKHKHKIKSLQCAHKFVSNYKSVSLVEEMHDVNNWRPGELLLSKKAKKKGVEVRRKERGKRGSQPVINN